MANLKKVNKPCKDCGRLMVAVNPQRLLCVDCRKEHVQKHNARYRDRHREEINRKAREKAKKALPVERTVDKYCAGCIYRGGQSGYLKCCNYYLITDKRRPCPAGEGCTVRKLKKGA